MPMHLTKSAAEAASQSTPVTAPVAAPVTADATAPVIIADRGEFIDALNRLRRGHVLVRPRAARGDETARCMLDSGVVYTAFAPLARYGLIGEYANPEGFDTMSYYRLTERGRRFADQACQAWRQRPLLERLLVRLVG